MKDVQYYSLLESLAETIADYRQGEISPITPTHVERWIRQFDAADRLIILAEMVIIMKRLYFSRVRVKDCIRSFLKEIITDRPLAVLPYVSFLHLQPLRSSQEAMLELVDEILREEYDFPIARTGTEQIHTYIYVDDGIYTGNRLRYNLLDGEGSSGWVSNYSSTRCRLFVYTIACHSEGVDYVRRYIKGPASNKQIKLQRMKALEINNNRIQGNGVEVLWAERMPNEPLVDTYVSHLHKLFPHMEYKGDFYRDTTIPAEEKLFSSPEARQVVERAFLKKGIQIINFYGHSAPSMRPLGFMKLPSLGFGTLFVTYRNIANNCPLVLWWGEPGYLETHPLGIWYPLFPRRTNARRDIIEEEQTFDDLPSLDDHPF